MLSSSARGTVLVLLAATLLCAQDWQTADSLPSVDFTGLTAGQKSLALKVLRTASCPCGCVMKMAECRVKDPPCSYSRTLAAIVVDTVKKGGNEAAVLAALHASPLMHRFDPISIPVTGDPVLGPAGAKVTIVEFSDFQCPYCALAVAKLNAVLKAYPKDVKLIYKQYPLEIHSQAALAAEAALAAQKQGKFWELHDAMYADRTHLTRQNILAMAGKIGLDMKRFQQDWDSPAVKQALAREQKQGDEAGVNGTPTIFIDGKRYNGELELDAIGPIIDKEIKGK
ncbi:MAG TPA: thioredoxin domain-containing protein [Bryobacteraceae bacterium]|nr:thioredoxin domain-containing protein [Bryobacteraceae bacterium]